MLNHCTLLEKEAVTSRVPLLSFYVTKFFLQFRGSFCFLLKPLRRRDNSTDNTLTYKHKDASKYLV